MAYVYTTKFLLIIIWNFWRWYVLKLVIIMFLKLVPTGIDKALLLIENQKVGLAC